MTFPSSGRTLARFTASPRLRRWFLFGVGGALNTILAYLVYLALARVINYQIAFALGYVVGISFSYFFNARVVFRAAVSLKSAAAYPLLYLIQYLASAATLGVLVGWLGVPKTIAPLCVTIAMIPLTYVMSKLVLRIGQGPRTHTDTQGPG